MMKAAILETEKTTTTTTAGYSKGKQGSFAFFIDHLTFVLIPYIMYQDERIILATAAVFYE